MARVCSCAEAQHTEAKRKTHRGLPLSGQGNLREVSALVFISPKVSPCCGCWLKHVHVRGMSKVNLTNTGLSFGSESGDGIGFHQAELPG